MNILIKVLFSTICFTGFPSCQKSSPSQNIITISPDAPVTDYDGNIYQTIKIGNQVWMAENLKSKHYHDGTPIVSFSYNNDETNATIYGRLYNWSAVMKGAASSNSNPSKVQGIAPYGWHIPSKAEWQQLIEYLGGLSTAGGKLKAVGTSQWIAPNSGATNETLFNALPAGMHDFSNIFQWLGNKCVFATSTGNLREYEVTAIMLESSSSILTIGGFHPNDAVSVRCVKD